MDVFSRLMMDRIIFLGTGINDQVANVIQAQLLFLESVDAKTIYDVPLLMLEEKLDKVVLKKLKIKSKIKADLSSWKKFVFNLKNPKNEVNIGLIGKYVELQDSYKSILESFIHAGSVNSVKVNVQTINS